MKKPTPSVLYKFTTCRRAFEIIDEQKVFYSKPARFNDPFDCQIEFPNKIVSFQVLKKQNRILEIVKETGILSLAKNSLSMLLWAHYANSHRGVCIGFKRTNTNNLGDGNITKSITYPKRAGSSKGYPILKIDAKNTVEDIVEKIIFTKAKVWNYEIEWRSLKKHGDQKYKIPGEIERVLLGDKISYYDSKIFEILCCKNNIPLYQCRKALGKFGIDVEKRIL
jgi:hypothetical protein